MAKPQRGLGKGIGALLGGDSDFTPLRQPVGYVNKEVVSHRTSQETTLSADDLVASFLLSAYSDRLDES